MPTKSAKHVYAATKGRRPSLREMEKFAKNINVVESGMPDIRLVRAMRQARLEEAFGGKCKPVSFKAKGRKVSFIAKESPNAWGVEPSRWKILRKQQRSR